MAKKIEDNSDDFMMRVMDILVDAEQRQLKKINPKEIKEVVSKLDAVNEERHDMIALRDSQKNEYKGIQAEITSYIETMSKTELLELPESTKLDMDNVEHKINKVQVEAAKRHTEEETPEPD